MPNPAHQPAAVARHLVAALVEGRRPPLSVLDEHSQLQGWDARELDELMRAFDAAEASCRLPDSVVATVRQALGGLHREARNGATDQMPALVDLSEWTEEMAPPDPGEDTSEIVARAAAAPAVAAPAPVAAPATPDAPAPKPLFVEPGTVLLGRYEVLRRLGRGGTAFVHLARDLRRDADDGGAAFVAIKSPRPEGDAARSIARLKREFRQTRTLSHPNIVRMHDLDRDGELWFITMEWLDGESLVERLQRTAPLVPAEALPIARACAQALAFAHGRGIVHGDFKPSNVMIDADGEVRLLDFGAAPDSTSVDEVEDGEDLRRMMTRCYASPETLEGDAPTARDDVFSLACVIYELLSGAHPFQRRAADVARAADAVVAPLAVLSAAQNAALARGLAWRRDDRPFGTLALIDGLEAVAEPEPVANQPAAPGATAAAVANDAVPAAAPPVVPPVTAQPAASIEPPPPAAERTTPPEPPLAQAAAAPPQAAVADAATPPASGAARPHPARIPFPYVAVGLGTAAMLGAILFLPHRAAAPAPQAVTPRPVATTPTAPATPLPPRAEKPSHERVNAPTTANREAAAAKRGPSTRIGFDAATLRVDESAFAAVLTLRRSGDVRSRVPIQWRINGGSAEAGQDYGGPAAGTARFAAGQTLRTLYVPLVDDRMREDAETFSVTLGTASDSTAVGPVGRTTVTIADDD